MSYARNYAGYGASDLGAYYEFSPHQVYAGYGYYHGMGAIRQTFNADQVWADAQKGGAIGATQASFSAGGCTGSGQHPDGPGPLADACLAIWKLMGSQNAAGLRAANAVREGLNELGYGPLTLSVAWGGADRSAWEAFTSKHNLPAGPGLVNKVGLDKMQDVLRGVGPNGPNGPNGPSKAGLGKVGWLLLLLAGGAATVALVSGKKRKGRRTGAAMVPVR